MLESKKVDLIRAKEAVDEYLYGRGFSGDIVEHPRYDSILTILALKLLNSNSKNYTLVVHEMLDKIVYIERDTTLMILEGVGENGTAITSKYYIDNQEQDKLKRLRLEAKSPTEVVCATISTYNEDGIEESLSTEQTLENGDVYYSKAIRDLKRPDVIKIERMKQSGENLTKLPEVYQLRTFIPALEDISPDRITIDPFDIMHYSFLGIPEMYRELTEEEVAFINMNDGKMAPLSDKYREEQFIEYKKANTTYGRTKVYEKGLAKVLQVDTKTIDN